MRSLRPLALALSLSFAVFGCAGDELGTEPEDRQETPSNPGDPDEPQDETVALAGTYQIVTGIDLGSNAFASDDLIGILQGIKEAPITTLVLAGAADLGLSPAVISAIESFLGGAIPDNFANALDTLAANIDEALGAFELVSELDVTDGAGPFAASHTVTGITVSFAGIDTFVDVTDNTTASAAVIDLAGTSITVSEHELPVPVGAAVSAILDNEIARSISPGATSLGEALAVAAKCADLSDQQLFGVSARSICVTGTAKLAENLGKALSKLDSVAIDMTLTGQAAISDDNSDGTFDVLEGAWVNGLNASLPFTGARM